jgi:hypothetical protein
MSALADRRGRAWFEQEGVMVAEAADEGLLQQTPLGA